VILKENPRDTIKAVEVTEPFLREDGFNSCHFAFFMKVLYTVIN